MQVSVESLEGLGRKLTITVDNKTVNKIIDKKLVEIAKTAKIDGFRQGKIPASIIKKRFYGTVKQEAMGEVIQETYGEALLESKLNPVNMPTVDIVDSEGKDFIYSATIEIYPEIEIADMSKFKIEQESVNITEKDIDNVIEQLKEQKKTWKEVKRRAKKDDQLTIDFVGSIDGKEFKGGAAQGSKVIIGSKTMISGFETGLKGMKKGEEKTITCKFPKKYQAEHLAGKEAEFKIKVYTIEEPEEVDIDEQFIKDFGVEDGTVETFRREVQANMERELNDALKNKNKSNVMDAILDSNTVDVPKAMVAEEIKALKENIKQYTQQDTKLEDSLFEDEATRRVKLGLIISKIVETEKLTADEEKVKKAVEEIAAPYNDPEQVISYYYSQPKMLKNVEAMVIEESVVALVTSQANVTVVDKNYQEVVAAKRASMAG